MDFARYLQARGRSWECADPSLRIARRGSLATRGHFDLRPASPRPYPVSGDGDGGTAPGLPGWAPASGLGDPAGEVRVLGKGSLLVTSRLTRFQLD